MTIPQALPFQPGPGRMAPAKKGGETKRLSAHQPGRDQGIHH